MRATGTVAASRPWARATAGLLSVLVLAACGSSTSKASTPGGGPSVRSSTTARATVPAPMSLAGLTAKLNEGSSSVTSAHITMSGTVGGESVLSLQGDETLVDGKLTAMRVNEKVGGVNLTLLIVDDSLYVKLPANVRTSGKPWVKATAQSTDPALRQLAASVRSLRQTASMSQYESLTKSASHFRTVGVERVSGATVSHYSLLVDVTKADNPAVTDAMRKTLKQVGITKIPIDLWVDEQGRTVRMAERFRVRGETVSIDVTMTWINRPVTIVAPPAAQVSTTSRALTV